MSLPMTVVGGADCKLRNIDTKISSALLRGFSKEDLDGAPPKGKIYQFQITIGYLDLPEEEQPKKKPHTKTTSTANKPRAK